MARAIPWIRADVGIRGGMIAAVRRLPSARAARVIDAAGSTRHTGIHRRPLACGRGAEPRASLRQGQPLIAQGVTTAVVNPDGGGPVDLAAQRAELEKGGLGPNVRCSSATAACAAR